MPNPIVHFEIAGSDGKKLQSFYAGLFGWKIDADNPMDYGLVEAQGSGIGGGITAAQATGVTIYVEVADLQATLDKATSAGGKVVVPPTEIPNMVTFAQFSDPEGNVVGLVKSDH